MLKKLFSILLLLVYGLSSMGMTIHAHYCCGELEKIGLQATVCKMDCPASTEINGKSCCDEKQVQLSLKSEYSNAKFIQPPLASGDAIKPVVAEKIFSIHGTELKILPEIFAPPPLQKDFTILFSVYRI
ncbi:MAG: HYC_CC_PP family protein [Flavisolibacter sp.]